MAAEEERLVGDNEKGDSKGKTVTINGKEIVKKQKKKRKNPIGEEAQNADPIAILGFGIVAYLDMLWCLFWTFTLYSLLLLPTLSFFSSGTAYENSKGGSSYLNTYLGNVGYASVQCAQIPAEVGKLSISCPYGTIGEIYDFGINNDADIKNLCINDADLNASCKPNNPWVSDGLNSAIGEESTLLEWGSHKSFWTGTQQQRWAKRQECIKGKDSTLFVQYSCIIPEDKQESKYNNMALGVGMSVLIAFLFTVSIRYMYQGGKIQMIEWDCSTVTAGDYSVEFPMEDKSVYLNWRDNVYEKPANDSDPWAGGMERGEAPAFALKKQLKATCEKMIDDWVADPQNSWALDELYGKSKKKNSSSQYGGTKVADIVFAFNNSKLINALRERGACIAAQDFDAMREKETEINELFQDFDDLTIPTAAFITFESDDSAVLADLIKKND